MVKKEMIAHLNTPLIEPLLQLEQHFLKNRESIKEWFKAQWQLTPPPVYGSVDLRNAGFKLAPIDMNLFPAGFNNLNQKFMAISVEAAGSIIHDMLPTAKYILIIPESHTRNLYYWANVHTLQNILKQAGFTVRFGLLPEKNVEQKQASEIVLQSGERIVLEVLKLEGNHLKADDFVADLVLLNNDLSEGVPDLLTQIQQPIFPPPEMGWNTRLKSNHFQHYRRVSTEFALLVDIDPWLINPLFKYCGKVDFMQQEGIRCMVDHAEILLKEIAEKYAQYKIPYDPFLVIKADAGTYGMAVMTIHSIEELKSMNRKQRTKMSITKGNQPVTRVLIQEGIYTFETVGASKSVAEPVIYLWGEQVVGGFYRVHKTRGVDENLNAPGMHFEPIVFTKTCYEPSDQEKDEHQVLFYSYGVVAQLSMLAAAREIKEQSLKTQSLLERI